MKYSAVILLSITGLVASDWQCPRIGETCKDYTQNTCIAGYSTGKCSGNNNRRCCKPCSHSCESTELSYSSRDGTCDTARGKCQHNSNYCEFPYQSGKCDGPSARQCCVGWNIHDMETTGASAKTADQDGLSHDSTGVEASTQMAKTDASAMDKYKSKILVAAKRYRVQAAVIAGIISRETRAGKVLGSNGFGFDGSGFGLMQVDKRFHSLQGGAFSQTHINQGTKILIDMINGVKNKHPSWSQDMALKGGISAYNAGVSNVNSYNNVDVATTGNDYANDVVARSQWYANNGY